MSPPRSQRTMDSSWTAEEGRVASCGHMYPNSSSSPSRGWLAWFSRFWDPLSVQPPHILPKEATVVFLCLGHRQRKGRERERERYRAWEERERYPICIFLKPKPNWPHGQFWFIQFFLGKITLPPLVNWDKKIPLLLFLNRFSHMYSNKCLLFLWEYV